MNTRATVQIDAPASHVWTVFTDVARWPSWTRSVTSAEPLDGAGIEVGHRFRIKQPWLPPLVWEVSAVTAPRSWTWTVLLPGAKTSATHDVSPAAHEQCVVTQVIEQSGPLGLIVGALTRRLTRRYLSLEGDGLKAASERMTAVAAQP